MAIVVWGRSEDCTQVMHTQGFAVTFKFVQRARYFGARALEISDPVPVKDMVNYMGGFELYDGPIAEWVPESVEKVEDVNWDQAVSWLKENAPEEVLAQLVAKTKHPGRPRKNSK